MEIESQKTKALECQLQHQSLWWISRIDFLSDWLVWSPCSPRDAQESSPAPQFKGINSLAFSLFYFPVLISIHDYQKNHSFDYKYYVSKAVSLIFNMLSRLVITFLPRSKHLLLSWLRSPSTVILEPKIIKSVTVSNVSPSICYEVMRLDATIFVFWMLSFKPVF